MSDNDDEITKLSAATLCARIGTRSLSPVEVLEAHLRRAEKLNPVLNALVTFAPDALEQARAAERVVMSGERLPPLHGLPVTIKDTIATANLRTTSGARTRAGYVPAEDAPAVARLRAAGAIVFAKTNASELALDYHADNALFGRTSNPHDLSRTPGGSSGGCAAAVSACLSPASLGSDLVGSIRIPAHFCGITGLFPTPGRVPSLGHFPPTDGVMAKGASLGPLARRVDDLALLFAALTHEEGDSHHSGHVGYSSHANEGGKFVSETELSGLRVACYTDDGNVPLTEETKEAFASAAHALRAAGLQLIEARPPELMRATGLWLALFSREVGEVVRAEFAGREDLAGASVRALLRREEEAGTVAATANAPEERFDAWAERERLRDALLERMRVTPLLLTPVGASPAFLHGARKVAVVGREFNTFRAFSFAQACNVFALPAVCVPAGRTREGLPVGVQIIGRPFQEQFVLAAARVIETALGGWQLPDVALPSEGGNPL